ncbi:MAG TPA: hypothetical protein VFK02_02125 [Kofleriaceae bacterium]|nr:hypothetical protein [Kofleriaceae bacterium]
MAVDPIVPIVDLDLDVVLDVDGLASKVEVATRSAVHLHETTPTTTSVSTQLNPIVDLDVVRRGARRRRALAADRSTSTCVHVQVPGDDHGLDHGNAPPRRLVVNLETSR